MNTVFVGGGTPSLLGGARLATAAGHGARALRAGARMPRSPPRPTRSRHGREFFDAHAGRPATPGCRSGMQSVAPHVLGVLDRVHSPGRAVDRGPRGAGRGLRARQPRPDLRHAGGDRRRPAALGRRRDRRPAWTTCRPTRWSSRTAPRWPGGSGAASWPLPTTTCWPTATSWWTTRLSRGRDCHWYEVSNWARPGGECRHNLGYWDGGQWWGAGPGAHGYVGDDALVECQASQRLCARG